MPLNFFYLMRMASRVASLPSTFQRVVIKRLTTNFAEASEIVSAPLPTPKENEVLVKTRYLGINASDINISAGRYSASAATPINAGLEALGEVVAVGKDVVNAKVGQAVAYMGIGAFSEYLCVPSQQVFTVTSLNPDLLALNISGRTAAISLDRAGHIKKRENVLITAAAGGTGMIAVQYAKSTGCHVIGTCSSEEKVQLLKELGCDRPINYKKENLQDVLKEEYPNGVDVIWETIGGDMFKTCLDNLAVRGRLIVIGYITHYQSEKGYTPMDLGYLPKQLLQKSQSVTGFLLFHYTDDFQYYHVKLCGMHEREKLKVFIDSGEQTPQGPFVGLESITRAVEHLHSGKSKGKVIIRMPV